MTENIVSDAGSLRNDKWRMWSIEVKKMLIRREKIEFFEKILADFHRKAGREYLPWRKKGAPAYEIWVSEIMLQQTQVSRVIPYYEKFLKRFPTVESLAEITWKEFLPHYRGLGYYVRGRNMLKAAKKVVEKYHGKFPRDVKTLQKLHGVGPYTAAAIASFAYGRDTIAWDTNLRRVVGRFFYGTRHLLSVSHPEQNKGIRDKRYKRDSSYSLRMTRTVERLFTLPAKTLNAAVMDFGSAMCTARPKCGTCPLSEKCTYFAEDGKSESRITGYELRKKKKERKESIDWKNSQVFLILHENHRKYYSPFKTKFSPFIIPASHNTRAGIKVWFYKKYNLELSVRPPHKKKIVEGKPTIFVNAQILSGKPPFRSFEKEMFAKYR